MSASAIPDSAISRALGRIVVVDDEENMVKILGKILKDDGWLVQGFSDPRLAVAHICDSPPDVVLTDMRMPNLTGMDVLRETKSADSSTSVVVCTAYGTMEGAVEAMKAGACDFVSKPFQTDELLLTLRNALDRTRLSRENEALSDHVARGKERGGASGILGESSSLTAAIAIADKAAAIDVPVLLLGESGTGKELFARRIHNSGPRRRNRFVPINCASIPENLMESELFGHEKGAFTGAERTKIGLMELASGGTLFLDEIGEMPFRLQGKLLRALQEHEIQRVGGLHAIQVNVRIVAATNRDPAAMAAAGEFRSDLLYRLDVLRIELPPLRQREGDIPLLLTLFLAEVAARHGHAAPSLDPFAAQALEAWRWPGNIRELRNVAERLCALVTSPIVTLADLPTEIRLNAAALGIEPREGLDDTRPFVPGGAAADTGYPGEDFRAVAGPFELMLPEGSAQPVDALDYREAKERFERQWLESLLAQAGGNMTAAARLAGLSRRHLYEKLEKLGIRPAE